MRRDSALFKQGNGGEDLEARTGSIKITSNRAVIQGLGGVINQIRVGRVGFLGIKNRQGIWVIGRRRIHGQNGTGLGVESNDCSLTIPQLFRGDLLHLRVERQNNAATLTVLARKEIAETLSEKSLRLAVQDVLSRSFHPGGLRECRREIPGRVRVERTLGIRALVARGSFNLFGGSNRSTINDDRAAIGFSSMQNRALIAAISVQ